MGLHVQLLGASIASSCSQECCHPWWRSCSMNEACVGPALTLGGWLCVSQSNSEVQYYETDFSANIRCFLVSDLYIIVGDILVLHQTILLLQKGRNPHSIIHHSTSMWIHFQVEWSALVWHSWPLSPLTTCRSEATYIIDTFGGGNWACLCLFLHFRMFPTILLGHIMNLMVKALLLQEKPAALRLQFILCVFILGLP